MFILQDINQVKKYIADILDSPVTLKKGDLFHKIEAIWPRRATFLQLAQTHKKAAYIIDQKELDKSFVTFKDTFGQAIPNLNCFYAMKANPHPHIIKTALNQGFNIDASSGLEITQALAAGANTILFSGPGKTIDELRLAISHQDKICINIDSFSELYRLIELTQLLTTPLNVGVRIHTDALKDWSKFGIPLTQLKRFWQEAQACPTLNLKGIQFHMSSNETTTPFRDTFKILGQYLATEFTKNERTQISYIDFGGGYLTYKAKAYHPQASLRGQIIATANTYFYQETNFLEKCYLYESLPLAQYAQEISEYINLYILPVIDCSFYCEPGRSIADNAMHLLLKVEDVKGLETVITDSGTNMMGWNIHNKAYLPVLNLTHPAQKEIPVILYGSLCTPNDIWNTHCYATEVSEGDYLLIPYHGSYTYAFAQTFIKAIPEVIILDNNDHYQTTN